MISRGLFLPLLWLLFLSLGSCATLERWGVRGQRVSAKIFKPIWIKNHDPQYNTGNLPIGLHGPLVYKGIVYAGHGAGEMWAYELSNGRPIWKVKDNAPYHSRPTPLLGEYITYGTVKGRVYVRHRLSGKLLWNVDLGAAIESEGTIADGRLYYHTRNHKIFCLDARSGKILWAYKRSIPFIATLQRASRPLIDKNRLYVGFADGTVAAFSVEEGVLLWEKKISSGFKFIDVDTSPLLFNNQLIVGSIEGPLMVMNKHNGLIQRRLKYHVTRKPLVWNSRLLFGTIDGKVVVLDKNFRLLTVKKIANAGISSIVPWKEGMVVSTVDGHLFYIHPQRLSILSSIHLGHAHSAVFAPLESQEGKLLAYSGRHRLYAFE